MLKNILNLEKSQQLSKSEQKDINGGLGDLCIQPSTCYGGGYLLNIPFETECAPGYRKIGHCICCQDQYVC